MLSVRNLEVDYGQAHILSNLALEVLSGEVVVLIGRNGAGKSTTMKAIMGLVPARAGEIRFQGHKVDHLRPYAVARLGIGYVPEDRRIFTDLSVRENLDVGRRTPSGAGALWTPDRVFALFPNLAEMQDRAGGMLSGGEQQMLAIARTLMGNPTLLLLDEPSEGLAPLIVEQMAEAILTLKRQGLSVLLSEQNLHFAHLVADRAYVIEKGRIRYSGTMAELAADKEVRDAYLSL